MKTHGEIDHRSLRLARAIVSRIDHDPQHAGLDRAREVCKRWMSRNPSPAVKEWADIVAHPWSEVRAVLLNESEDGQRLRQSSPFCGILTPRQRWQIYKQVKHEARGS